MRNLTLEKINVSRISQTSLFNTNDGNGDLLGDLTNIAKSDLNDLLGDLTSDSVKATKLPDFFTIYLHGYYSGMYSPNASAVDPKPRVMECTNHSAIFSFNPTEMMEHALPHNITRDDLHWPTAIKTAERALRAFSIVLSVFYILSLLSIGIAVFLAAWKIFFNGTVSTVLTRGLDIVSHPIRSQTRSLIRSPCPVGASGNHPGVDLFDCGHL
jgi:hypothetical protein